MASLIDNLITTLQKENEEYRLLLKLSMEKTGIIVAGKPDELSIMVEKEQEVIDRITVLEKKRAEATNDIALVLNRDPATLTLPVLTGILSAQKREAEALNDIHDKLKATMSRMVKVNEHNKVLLQESIEMVQFEMNLIQSMKQGPSNANYSGMDYANNDYGNTASFDAKQ